MSGQGQISVQKRKSHAARTAKRKAEKAAKLANIGSLKATDRQRTTHAKASTNVETSALNLEEARMAKTGYVGLKEPRDDWVYLLDELIAEDGAYKFRLVRWDGRSVQIGYPVTGDSMLTTIQTYKETR